MKIFGTGHRPEDANGVSFDQMIDLVCDAIVPKKLEVSAMLCGMASGFDLAFGVAAEMLQLDLWAVKPWAGHAPRDADREIYESLENYASRIIIVNDAWTYPGPWVYDDRNKWMVDNGDEGVAFWNGKRSGGTYNCLKYADRMGKLVINVYPSWRANT